MMYFVGLLISSPKIKAKIEYKENEAINAP